MKTNMEEIIHNGIFPKVNFTKIDNPIYRVESMGYWIEMTQDEVIEYLQDSSHYEVGVGGIYGLLQETLIERVKYEMKKKEDNN